jgi:hypothetical protein
LERAHYGLFTMIAPAAALAMFAATTVSAAGCADTVARRAAASDAQLVCAGISEAQSHDLFADLRDDVESVDVVREAMTTKAVVTHSLGADIHIRPRQGLTAPWLERLAKCHALRESAGASCTTAQCPVGLARVTANVASTSNGFTMALRSDDPAIAQEIARRALLLVEQPAARSSQ